MLEKVRQIMAETFGIAVEQIGDDASPDTLKQWDSLKHLNLVLALEDEYGLTFGENEIVEMLSLERILATLRNKGVE